MGDTESVAVRDPLLASDVVLLLRNLATEGPESQASRAPSRVKGRSAVTQISRRWL